VACIGHFVTGSVPGVRQGFNPVRQGGDFTTPVTISVLKAISRPKRTPINFHAAGKGVNVAFKGVYFLTQKLLPLINDGGRIVNVSSGFIQRLCRFVGPGGT
jgi:NAD(P)-dependent dehydrogenase (short-subunit alcohol dehydrogenase family)